MNTPYEVYPGKDMVIGNNDDGHRASDIRRWWPFGVPPPFR